MRSQNVIRNVYKWLRSRDLLALLLVLAAVGGLWAFIELADEVMEGETRAFDERLIRAMRHPDNPKDALGAHWFEDGVRDITALGSVAVLALVTLAVLGFVVLHRQFHAFWLVVAAVAGALLLNFVLKQFFDRPRPELVPTLMRETSASFPSGHSMLSAVVYLTLGALLTRLVEPVRLKLYILATAIFLSALVGLSRIYLGVHFPTDVLAGWTVGLVWAIVCWLVAENLQKKGLVEKPGEVS